jgi:hypothetical protein
MYLSELGYSELVQRLFEKLAFFRVDPLSGQSGEGKNKIIIRRAVKRRGRGGKMKNKDMLLI